MAAAPLPRPPASQSPPRGASGEAATPSLPPSLSCAHLIPALIPHIPGFLLSNLRPGGGRAGSSRLPRRRRVPASVEPPDSRTLSRAEAGRVGARGGPVGTDLAHPLRLPAPWDRSSGCSSKRSLGGQGRHHYLQRVELSQLPRGEQRLGGQSGIGQAHRQ
ncbi:uncharacterized protein LOC143690474 [Tamandua tetradactyla]|uniref:uncharacterized protein LOC143690474 n=1 Tax=Tamandua tetradactyla TaxID=48850 RepID=UPI0040548D45